MLRKLRRYNLPISDKLLRECKRLARVREVSTAQLIRTFIRMGLEGTKTETVDAPVETNHA